jgi:tetratricopeptide (TPR) repeat protein
MNRHKVIFAAVAILSVWFAVVSFGADEIKDHLDQAKAAYTASIEKATRDATDSFDQQIRIVSQTGDLDAVQQLRAERAKFAASQAISTSSVMRAHMAQYRDARALAETRLRTAYEAAVSEYTKAGNFDDAQMIKRVMVERFSPQPAAPAPGSTTAPSDPIIEMLQKAKSDFVQAIASSHADVLAVIDAKAKAAAEKGDLDGYKKFAALHEQVQKDILVPDSVRDSVIRNANAKLLTVADAEFGKLQLAYQTAIRDYTKALRINEAESVKAEMADGGWFENYEKQTSAPGHTVTVDLLKAIDIGRDTVRVGWRLNSGVLEPAGWAVDNGPLIQIPISIKGSYELRASFVLGRAADDIFFLVPVGEGYGLLCIRNTGQNLEDVEGAQGKLAASQTLALGNEYHARFQVAVVDKTTAKFIFTINGRELISWSGPAEKVKKIGEMWRLGDRSYIGIATKYGKIRDLKLIADSSVISRKNP